MKERMLAGDKFRLRWLISGSVVEVVIRRPLTLLDTFQILGEIGSMGHGAVLLQGVTFVLQTTDIDEETEEVMSLFSKMFVYLSRHYNLKEVTYVLPPTEGGRELKALITAYHKSKDSDGVIDYKFILE